MMMNFRQLPKMTGKDIVSEFKAFLKERQFSEEAQARILAKAKVALACQDIDVETVLKDYIGVDNTNHDMILCTCGDPPDSSESKEDPTASCANESFEKTSIEVFGTQGAGSTTVVVCETVVHEIENEVADDLVKVAEKEIDPVLNCESPGQRDSVEEEEDKVSSAKSTGSKDRKRNFFIIKLLSRLSCTKKRTPQKAEEVENDEDNTRETAEPVRISILEVAEMTAAEEDNGREVDPETEELPKETAGGALGKGPSPRRTRSTKGMPGLARSLSLFRKSKRNHEEKRVVLPMASRAAESGNFTAEEIPIPSFPSQSIQTANRVNVFDWATGEKKEVEETAPFDEAPWVLETAPLNCGPMDPYHSTKAKRQAWRKRTLPQKEDSQSNDENWADFSQCSRKSNQDGNKSTESPVAVDDFDSILTPFGANNDWADFLSATEYSYQEHREHPF